MDPYAYSAIGNGSFRAPPQNQGYSYGWGNSSVSAAAIPQNFRNTPSFAATRGYGDVPKMPKGQFAQNRAGVGYGRWVTPGGERQGGADGGSFPKKAWSQPPFGQNFFKKGPKKETDPTGKTPAMLLHEVFKEISENYEEVASHPKAYRCILTVAGQQFTMVAPAKKTAKQKTAEMALRTLRPDLNVTPYEDGVTVQPVTADGNVPVQPVARPAVKSEARTGEDAPPAKKIKLNALESALSLLDCMRKLCAERVSEGPFNPVFDITDVTENASTTGDKRRFRATLTFAEQGKVYTHEGFGKLSTRDVVVREALLDLFNVPQTEIRRIVRRHLMGKLTDMPIIQTLYQVAHLCGCEVEFKVDIGTEQKAVGHAAPTFVAVCTLIDHSMDDKKVEFTSPPSRSKHEAKEYAAHELLRSHFDIDPPAVAAERPPVVEQPVPPCQKLHVLLAKQNRSVTPNIKYEDLGLADDSVNQMGTIFKSKLIINDKEEFIGSGKSKKAAKNDAAMLALKKIFMFDYNDPESEPVFETPPRGRRGKNGSSQLCFDVAEYAKREYYSMCNFYAVKHSTEVAAFFLVNELDEKRLVAIGSSRPGTVDGQTVGTARGTAIIHFDPIILARRSLIRYLINELGKVGDPKCIFVRGEDGMLRLNEGLRLVLYATYAPNCSYSCKEASVKKLSVLGNIVPSKEVCASLDTTTQTEEISKILTEDAFGSTIGPSHLIPAPDEVQSLTDIQQSGRLNVHCAADKIFKWSKLGVQGALLSTVMHPILPHSIFFGSQAPVSDASLLFALFGRMEPPKNPCKVESIKNHIILSSSPAHVWTRDMEHVEMLNIDSGRTNKGSPSRLCKAAIYEAFLKLAPEGMKCSTYMEAKEKALAYNEAKRVLYEQMETAGLGKWQTKPAKLVDFSLDSFDV